MRRPLFELPRWGLLILWPVAVAALVLASWAVDTAAHAGVVPRNVTVAGRAVSGLEGAELRARVIEIAEQFERSSVAVGTASGVEHVTAADLGMTVDVEATVAAVEEAVRRDPLAWLGSLIGGRSADLAVEVDRDAARAVISALATVRVAPREPTLDGSSGELRVVDGVVGEVLDVDAMVAAIPTAVPSASGPVELGAIWRRVQPRLEPSDLDEVRARAAMVVDAGLRLRVNDHEADLPAAVAARWFGSEIGAAGAPELVVDRELALADLVQLMAPGDIGGSDDAVYDVVDGQVVVAATEAAQVCCEPYAVSTLIGHALNGRTGIVELPVRSFTPAQVLEEAEKLGIVEEVSSSTTFHAPNQGRVVNIQRFADLVRGHVIRPGERVSINELVGERTVEKGFVPGGFISGGVLKSDIGGGVSQVATTIFNAAFFAGLDIPEYRAHSIYFSRYPYGREATISWPEPDLVLENNTPYGVLIWTSYTDTSITVSMYSTKHLDAYQTDQWSTFQDQCTRVTTERTRIYHHGEATTDRFWALYRPAEGFNCDGTPSDPSVTTLAPEEPVGADGADGDG